MDEIVSQVQRVSQLIGEISSATAEQSTGIGQVGDAVTQLDQVTQQNAALVEESAAAAESLKQQAATLAEVVSVFKLGIVPDAELRASSTAEYPSAPSRRRPAHASNAMSHALQAKSTTAPAPRRLASATAPAGNDDWSSF
jgi:methyl-accepting chemotaxis protein